MELVEIGREFLKMVTGQLDPYTSKKGEIVTESPTKVSLFTPSHIQFAKYGRGPGKQPPVDQILEFVESRNIQFDGLDKRGTAWAIAVSIGKKGTLNWVPNAPNALEQAIDNSMKDYLNALSNYLTIEVNDQIMGIYSKTFPETIEFKI